MEDTCDQGAFTWEDHLADIEDDRRWRAYHEGGHVAAAWALGAISVKADILQKPPQGGLTVWKLGNDGRSASVDGVTICFAGPAAAKRYAPRRRDGGGNDRENIARDLAALCRTPDAEAIVREHCRCAAERLVAENWDAVEAVAAALLDRECLTYGDLADVLAGVVEARQDAEGLRQRRAWADLVARTPST